MTTIAEIKDAGFIGFKTIRELTDDSSSLPHCGGVYLFLFPEISKVSFLTIGTGGFFKGKDPNVHVRILEESWVPNSRVVYIGKATSLRKRLHQYFCFGQGKNIGHYGGRYIWQLKNSDSLIVCWKPLTGEDPRLVESNLIQEFVFRFGKRPFANLCN